MPMQLPECCHTIIPSGISSRGHKIGPIFLCVCLLVSALMAEPHDLRNLAWGITLIIPKAKINRSENVILKVSNGLTFADSLLVHEPDHFSVPNGGTKSSHVFFAKIIP